MNPSKAILEETRQGPADAAFDPFRDLLHNHASRPTWLQELSLDALSPFQRALLAIDGTVTKFIEAYALEPVEIVRLSQQTQALPMPHRWLAAPQNTEVVSRQVLLRGGQSAAVYAYAVSLLVPARLPPALLDGLEAAPKGGLGQALLNSQIESRREILWFGQESIDNLPDDIRTLTGSIFISRAYRIMVGGQPVMLINEKFPIGWADWRA